MWFTHKVEVNSGGGGFRGDNNGDTDFEKALEWVMACSTWVGCDYMCLLLLYTIALDFSTHKTKPLDASWDI